MFYGCESLKTIDLSSFDTSSVTKINNMFHGCYDIISVDLSNFNTSLVENMEEIFFGCNSLTSINLSKFNTSLVKNMRCMFCGCNSLISLNLSSFNTSSVKLMDSLFYGCTILDKLDLSNFDTSLVINMESMFYGCLNLRSLTISFDTTNVIYMNNMFDSCNALISLNLSSFNTSSVSTMAYMFENCELLKFLNLSNFDISNVSDVNYMFYNCRNLQYINLENAIEINNLTVDNMLELVSDNIIYCIDEEKAPKISGLFKEKIGSRKDCSNFDLSDTIYSSTNILIYKEDICITKDFFEGKCQMNISNNEEKEIFGNKIIEDIMDGSLDSIISCIINNNTDYIVKENNQIYQLSTVSYQKNNSDNTMTIIDLGQCESILKKGSGLDENEELIILKIDNYIQGFNVPIIEYVIFNKNGKILLDLNYCDKTPINYYIPLLINESELYKYDSSGGFYTDGCDQYTTEYGTDMTLYDRKNEYNKNNYSLCETNCEFKGYNSDTLKVECECKIKNHINFFSDINIDKDKLLNQFINIKKISNIWVLKCFNLVFSSKGLISNIGSYVLILIISINIICSILFYKKGYYLLNIKIKKIIEDKFNPPNIEDNKINLPPKRKGKKRKKSRISNQPNNDILVVSKNNLFNNYTEMDPKKKENEGELKESDKNEIQNQVFNDYELNNLAYKDAIKYDKRGYWEYYLSLIRTKHLIVFTFYTSSDYNSIIIKISLFLLIFALFYIVNALFFNDSTMHKIYEDHGIFNFVFQIPQILYSTIISIVIKTILNMLSLTEKNIIEIKNQKSFALANNKMKEKKKCLLIKFILFFTFSFLFLLLFWYYISCFCAVYKNTQIYLIEDTAISFGTSLIYPFALNMIPGLIRIHSIKNKDKSCLYLISKILQLI